MSAKRSGRRRFSSAQAFGSEPPQSPPTAAAADGARWLVWPVLLWVVAIHFSGLFGVFVFDDQWLLEKETLTRFFDFDWLVLSNRPLTTATFALNFSYGGAEPIGFHLVNLLIHLFAVACLFALVRRTLLMLSEGLDGRLASAVAAAAALLWGVHPLTTAAITYIVQRAESLATLGILFAVYAWSRAFARVGDEGQAGNSYSRGWAIVCVISAYAAYGSKEMSAGLPLIILLYDQVFIAKSWRPLLRRWPWYMALVLPLVVGAMLILPQTTAPSGGRSVVGFDVKGFSAWSYFTSQPRVFLEYLRLSVFPLWQSLDYGWLPPREPRWQIAGLLGWLGLAASIACLWRRARPLAFLVLAALLVLAPTSTLLPLQDIIFEHRFYFPLACFVSGCVGWAVIRNGHPDKSQSIRIGWRVLVTTIALAVPLSWRTIVRNMDYTSQPRIHRVDTENNPQNPRAWYSLAATTPFDRPEPKIEMMERAIGLSRERGYFYAGTDYKWPRDLADTLFLSGRVSESRPYYEQALPNSYDELQRTEILFQLAMIASIEGRVADAEKLFQQTLSGHPKIRPQVETVYAAHQERLKNQ